MQPLHATFGLALGYEDLNDHDELRHDLALQTAVDRDSPLASAATLCRFENQAEKAWVWHIQEVLVATYIASQAAPPAEVILDFDATDDRVHGEQKGRAFQAYYKGYCFLPLDVYAGDHPLAAYLREGNAGQASEADMILKWLVERLRQAWPSVRIVLRADSGFWNPDLASWCEVHGVFYVIGLAQNPRLLALSKGKMARAAIDYRTTKTPQRRFTEFRYAAESWDRKRRVIARLQHTGKGAW